MKYIFLIITLCLCLSACATDSTEPNTYDYGGDGYFLSGDTVIRQSMKIHIMLTADSVLGDYYLATTDEKIATIHSLRTDPSTGPRHDGYVMVAYGNGTISNVGEEEHGWSGQVTTTALFVTQGINVNSELYHSTFYKQN